MLPARWRELFGLLPVALLVTAGFTAVLITRSESTSEITTTYGLFFLGCCVVAHLFIRARLPDADPYLVPLAAVLAAFGLVMIYRIDEDLAREQAQWFVVGLLFFVATIVFLRDHRVLERYRYTIAAAGIALLFMPRLPGIGSQVNGAFLAVRVGSIQFQPAEFAKIAIIIFLASYLADTREVLVKGRVPRLSAKHMGPLLLVWGAAMLMLIFIRDLGSSLMFFGGFLILLYVATARLSLVLAGLGMFVGGATFLANSISHVHERVDCMLHPYDKGLVDAACYQIAQGTFAQADGGLFGKGFGESLLELPNGGTILPAPHTDLIYAVITNELGLFGAAALVIVYLLFAQRGFKTAIVARDGFSKLLATGLTAVFALQVFVIVGGVTKTIPLTGVTLPFVSYGGSSIVANFVLLALLLVVSDSARRDAPGQGGLVAT
jgi:cell division protein FtsW (lipid II flippase)